MTVNIVVFAYFMMKKFRWKILILVAVIKIMVCNLLNVNHFKEFAN